MSEQLEQDEIGGCRGIINAAIIMLVVLAVVWAVVFLWSLKRVWPPLRIGGQVSGSC